MGASLGKALMLIVLGVIVWRLQKRLARWLVVIPEMECPECGYAIPALRDPRCTECGLGLPGCLVGGNTKS